MCVDLLIEEIEESTRDETAFREFRDVYLYEIDKNAQRYVSIYNEYIRKNGINVQAFTDEEYQDFIKKYLQRKESMLVHTLINNIYCIYLIQNIKQTVVMVRIIYIYIQNQKRII